MAFLQRGSTVSPVLLGFAVIVMKSIFSAGHMYGLMPHASLARLHHLTDLVLSPG